jgi:hypothetical protein
MLRKSRRAPTPSLAVADASGVDAVVDGSLLNEVLNSTTYGKTPTRIGLNGGVCRGRERPRLGRCSTAQPSRWPLATRRGRSRPRHQFFNRETSRT